MLDEIEQEFPYDILSNSDLKTLYLLFFRIEGYSVSEISYIFEDIKKLNLLSITKIKKKSKKFIKCLNKMALFLAYIVRGGTLQSLFFDI